MNIATLKVAGFSEEEQRRLGSCLKQHDVIFLQGTNLTKSGGITSLELTENYHSFEDPCKEGHVTKSGTAILVRKTLISNLERVENKIVMPGHLQMIRLPLEINGTEVYLLNVFQRKADKEYTSEEKDENDALREKVYKVAHAHKTLNLIIGVDSVVLDRKSDDEFPDIFEISPLEKNTAISDNSRDTHEGRLYANFSFLLPVQDCGMVSANGHLTQPWKSKNVSKQKIVYVKLTIPKVSTLARQAASESMTAPFTEDLNIEVMTINAKDLSNSYKIPDFTNWLKTNNICVANVQEERHLCLASHPTPRFVEDLNKDSPTIVSYDDHYYWFTNNRVAEGQPGTAILVRKDCIGKEKVVVKIITPGCVQMIVWRGIKIINVYLPAGKKRLAMSVLKDISDELGSAQNQDTNALLMAGDFNITLGEGDRQHAVTHNKQEKWEQTPEIKLEIQKRLKKILEKNKLFDLWEKKSDPDSKFTYEIDKKAKNSEERNKSRSRIDHIHGNMIIEQSTTAFKLVRKETFKWKYKKNRTRKGTDHHGVVVTLRIIKKLIKERKMRR